MTTQSLIRALKILARDIHSDDGVANEVIDQAAMKIEELDDHLTAAKRDIAEANRVSASATKRIQELEADVETTVWKYTPAMADAKITQLNARIRELERHLSPPLPPPTGQNSTP